VISSAFGLMHLQNKGAHAMATVMRTCCRFANHQTFTGMLLSFAQCSASCICSKTNAFDDTDFTNWLISCTTTPLAFVETNVGQGSPNAWADEVRDWSSNGLTCAHTCSRKLFFALRLSLK